MSAAAPAPPGTGGMSFVGAVFDRFASTGEEPALHQINNNHRSDNPSAPSSTAPSSCNGKCPTDTPRRGGDFDANGEPKFDVRRASRGCETLYAQGEAQLLAQGVHRSLHGLHNSANAATQILGLETDHLDSFEPHTRHENADMETQFKALNKTHPANKADKHVDNPSNLNNPAFMARLSKNAFLFKDAVADRVGQFQSEMATALEDNVPALPQHDGTTKDHFGAHGQLPFAHSEDVRSHGQVARHINRIVNEQYHGELDGANNNPDKLAGGLVNFHFAQQQHYKDIAEDVRLPVTGRKIDVYNAADQQLYDDEWDSLRDHTKFGSTNVSRSLYDVVDRDIGPMFSTDIYPTMWSADAQHIQ